VIQILLLRQQQQKAKEAGVLISYQFNFIPNIRVLLNRWRACMVVYMMLIFTFETLFTNLLQYSQEHTQIRKEQNDWEETMTTMMWKFRGESKSTVNTAHIILKFYYKR
jgi:hypothetical protein